MFNSNGVILGRDLWDCVVEGLELIGFGGLAFTKPGHPRPKARFNPKT